MFSGFAGKDFVKVIGGADAEEFVEHCFKGKGASFAKANAWGKRGVIAIFYINFLKHVIGDKYLFVLLAIHNYA